MRVRTEAQKLARKQQRRIRICTECGISNDVAKDNPAKMCLLCQRKLRSKLGHLTKVTEGHTDRECEVCGTIFDYCNSKIRYGKEIVNINFGRFCSNKCKAQWMRGQKPAERV